MSRRQAPWIICSCCKGDGTVDGLGVVSRDDFSDEEWEEYLEGAYNAPCGACAGTGKVREDAPEPVVRFGSDGQRVFYADEADASEHRLRMAEGWC